MKRVFNIRELPTSILVLEAINANKIGQIDKAEILSRKILEREPNNFRGLYLSGVIKFQRGDPEGSLALLEQALATKQSLDIEHAVQDRAAALLHAANALRRLGRVPEALEACTNAIGCAPDFALAHLVRADILFQMQKYKEAWADYQALDKLSPGLKDESVKKRMDELKKLL